jgi:hypothetical protein
MPVPTTNVTLSSLQTEYGGVNPILMSEYYRGGSNVPPDQTSTNGTIPTTGAITMGVFRGTTKVSAALITINTLDVTATFPGASQASAVFGLDSDGFTYTGTYTNTQSFTQGPSWITPTSQAAEYEVFATLVVGPLSFGTTGSWVPLSADQYWRLTVGTGNSGSAQFNISIRKVGTTTVLDTATITLYVDTSNE